MVQLFIFVVLVSLLQNVVGEGRIKSIFDKYRESFSAELLLEVFKESNGQEEFLLNESDNLIAELVTEFPNLLQVETIGYSGEGRPI